MLKQYILLSSFDWHLLFHELASTFNPLFFYEIIFLLVCHFKLE